MIYFVKFGHCEMLGISIYTHDSLETKDGMIYHKIFGVDYLCTQSTVQYIP